MENNNNQNNNNGEFNENQNNNSNNNNNFDFNEAGKGFISKFLNFDSYITPTIIKFIYIAGVVITALSGLVMMLGGLGGFGSGGAVLGGIILILLSPFLPRIWAELLIVNFKILETLQQIRDKK